MHRARRELNYVKDGNIRPGAIEMAARQGSAKRPDMADIVNLNQYRKKRNRRAAGQRAAENRGRFGLAKGERTKAQREAEKLKKELDDKRLE